MRLSMRDVRKSFGATVALASVDLAAEEGEVHAIIGENGAGKSTLMKVLSGVIAPDAGEMALDGAPYRPNGPRDARAAGVAMVHQELSLCPHLSVLDNVLVGDEPTRYGFLDRRKSRARVEAALAQVRASFSPDARVSDLSPAEQQLVEIARALDQPNVRVLILDEPTSSLAGDDVDRLFQRVQSLRERGLTILYISHFLEEVRRIADRFTVLRDGRTVGNGVIADVTNEEIVKQMAGRAIEQLFPRGARTPGDVVLRVEALAGATRPKRASFELRRGEVLGIAGLIGAGRTELLRAIFGLDRVVKGEITVGLVKGARDPHDRLAEGVGLLSEDRKREGLALARSLADNLTLSALPRFVSERRQREAAEKWTAKLAIKARDVLAPVSDLSGGNQQKVALARLLHHDVDVLLLDEPTRGIDVGSKAQIYALIDELAAQGKAVLMVSSYLPELLGVCDRLAVMRKGELGEARAIEQWTEHAVLTEATR